MPENAAHPTPRRAGPKHGGSYGYKVHANADALQADPLPGEGHAANADDGQTLKEVLDPRQHRRAAAGRPRLRRADQPGLLQAHGLRDGIARRAKPGQERRVRLDAHKAISAMPRRGEHVFAGLVLGGKCVRAMTLARNELAIC
ncbi:hypothetical protein [Enterobacter kobei]|uniref:hypothetical protein n=1 Tax=Enterobacter kobei TaxID=208224 RepID=UPI00287683BC|nr:hypothetical protein [Enterobacter kobei]MDS0026500.1 hypothetical protein [Enterobacter kobei]